jgi:hypothetical protein
MGKKLFILGAVIGCTVILSVGVVWFIRARNTSSVNSCVNNLRLIDAAKQQLMLENPSATKSLTWEALTPFIGRAEGKKPVCPEDGTYTIGAFNELPSCSLGNERPNGHKLIP